MFMNTVLLIVLCLLSLFNAASMFVIGSAVMKNTQSTDRIIVMLKKKVTRGRRYTPDPNLMDVPNSSFPQENS
jgi:hypothetical protein